MGADVQVRGRAEGSSGHTRTHQSPSTHQSFCRDLIDVDLLTVEERDWVNSFQEECRLKVSPLLQGDQRALDWLNRETQML